MTAPHFTDRLAAARWLHDQAGTIAALREYGTPDEALDAVADYAAVAVIWGFDVEPPPRELPWYQELAIVAAITAALLGFFWLTGSIR